MAEFYSKRVSAQVSKRPKFVVGALAPKLLRELWLKYPHKMKQLKKTLYGYIIFTLIP
jgi:hypothetical protein